jgi:predicted MFS family arabinose efflux permease
MTFRQLKIGYFALEGINAFATSFYFSYLFFYMRAEFGFGNLGNLTLGAINGAVYIPAALYGGRFAQRRGYFSALKLGFGTMAIALAVGALWAVVAVQVAVLVGWTIGMAFTWPSLEALSVEGESPADVPRVVGCYNVVWAGTSAMGYFIGGTLLEQLGWKSLFWLPVVLHAAQFLAAFRCEKEARLHPHHFVRMAVGGNASRTLEGVSREVAKGFQRLAWTAIPFAYIGINTVIPLLPEIALRLHLTTAQAGFFCSIWQFARLGTFAGLWRWTRWHYRFGWLAAAFGLLVVSFAALLVFRQAWLLGVVQLVFGWSVGLIYYSSLFYSMDASDTKGEHGGVHEAALGLGIFGGPAIGALALRLDPQQTNMSAWAVSLVLLVGLAALIAMHRRQRLRHRVPSLATEDPA